MKETNYYNRESITMKKTLLWLMPLFLFFALASCGGEALPEMTPLENADAYTVIRPDVTDGVTSSAAVRLRTALGMQIGTDFVKRGQEVPTGTSEILVGSTNRPESDAEGLLCEDFCISFQNGRLAIVGGTPDATSAAVDWFIENCFADGVISVPSKPYYHRGEYPLADTVVDGVRLSDMKIAANPNDAVISGELAEYLMHMTGVRPEVTDDLAASPAIRLCYTVDDDFFTYSIRSGSDGITLTTNTLGAPISVCADALRNILKADTKTLDEKYTMNGELHQLNCLSNTYAKLKNDKELNIVYTGGSVTDGYRSTDPETRSWVSLLNKWFGDTCGAKINSTRASIGGTGSYLSAFRFDREMAVKEPDLFVIECCINDHYNGISYEETLRNSETLIRKAYAVNPNCDILYVLTFDSSTARTIYPQMQAHIDAAAHYGLMTVMLSDRVYAHLAATGEAFEDYFADGVHPADAGYALYAKIIEASILADFPETEREVSVRAHSLPEPLTDPMLNAHMIYPGELVMTDASGWEMQKDAAFSWMGKRYGGRIHADQVGSRFTFTFEGTDLGLLFGRAPGFGIISVTVDGEKIKDVTGDGSSQNPKDILLCQGLKAGKHAVTIELTGEGEFEIGGVLVN